MLLHTLNASVDSSAFRDLLMVAQSSDAILLMGDGVYAAMDRSDACKQLQTTGAELYVLSSDASAAGILEVVSAVTLVDMPGFVKLTERFPRQQAWY